MRSNIGLKKVVAEAGSAVLIRDDSLSSIGEYSARVVRSATLDGGAVIENLGYSDGDRTITIEAKGSPELIERIKSMIVDELYLVVSTRDGVFYGAMNSLITERNEINLTIIVKERDDA